VGPREWLGDAGYGDMREELLKFNKMQIQMQKPVSQTCATHATPRVPIVRRGPQCESAPPPPFPQPLPHANELSFVSKHTKTEGMYYVQLEPKGCTGAIAPHQIVVMANAGGSCSSLKTDKSVWGYS